MDEPLKTIGLEYNYILNYKIPLFVKPKILKSPNLLTNHLLRPFDYKW